MNLPLKSFMMSCALGPLTLLVTSLDAVRAADTTGILLPVLLPACTLLALYSSVILFLPRRIASRTSAGRAQRGTA